MKTAVPTNRVREMSHHGKISPEFAARLERLKPAAKLHAIVVLNGGEAAQQASRTRPTPEQRRAAMREIGGAAMGALRKVDEILHGFGGRRLSEKPTALGTISIESNPAGIAALANSSYVRSILEDQPISRVL